MGVIIMRNWDLREFGVRVHLPSPIWEVHVLIRHVITPIRGLPNPLRQVILPMSHIRSNPPPRPRLHPPSLSASSTTQPSSQNTKFNHPSLSLRAMIMSLHRVQHPPTILWVPLVLMMKSWPLNVASTSGVPPYKINCHQPALYVSSMVQSPCHIPTVASQLTDKESLITQRTVHWPPRSSLSMLLNRGLQELLQSRPIMASNWISELTRLGPLCLNDRGFQVPFETCSIPASKFAWSWPQCAYQNSLDHGF